MSAAQFFVVFLEDRQIYGPFDVNLLQEWAKQGLISTESWIFAEQDSRWHKASEFSELNDFPAAPASLPQATKNNGGLSGGQLRRIRLFSDMTNEQAEKFIHLVEKIKVNAFRPIVKQGDHGDSMFLIMDGEVRVSLKAHGKEETITMMSVGEFFGENALLEEGPHPVGVTANKDCTLLKLSKKEFDQIVTSHPDLGVLFLGSMNRLLGVRLHQANGQFIKAQNFHRGASALVKPSSEMQWKKKGVG